MKTSEAVLRIKVQKKNQEGDVTYEYEGTLLSQDEHSIVLEALFDRADMPFMDVMFKTGDRFVEYYYTERWYNIFRFEEPVGTLRNWYCNITMPPTISETAVDYVDLDIDVLIWPDQCFQILDVDEYDENARKYGLSDDARQQVSQALSQLSIMLQNRDFPFNLKNHGT